MQKVAYNWICGIRASLDGLIVDPCVPKKWRGFKAKRTFRGSTYNITVTNPQRVEKGVKSLTVDGKKVKGTCIPVPAKKGTFNVVVVMG